MYLFIHSFIYLFICSAYLSIYAHILIIHALIHSYYVFIKNTQKYYLLEILTIDLFLVDI